MICMAYPDPNPDPDPDPDPSNLRSTEVWESWSHGVMDLWRHGVQGALDRGKKRLGKSEKREREGIFGFFG